jgi:hypothetical protein
MLSVTNVTGLKLLLQNMGFDLKVDAEALVKRCCQKDRPAPSQAGK